MSHSPATPSKSVAEAGKSFAPSTKDFTSALGTLHSSLHEPSPASTYGETAAGDSIPTTPQADCGHDESMALLEALRNASLNDSVECGSGSPFPARQVKNFVRGEQRSVFDHDSTLQNVSSPPARIVGTDSSASPVKTLRYQQIKHSPTWRAKSGFGHNVQHDSSEDPFVTSHDRAAQDDTKPNEGVFQPREDRANLPLSADTAQAMLPPNACVFVANLTQVKSDEELEKSVSTVFQAFGNVYVKIRRDNKGMPFAFCQYENVRDAQRAITMGRGLEINGRACRTEVAKVNRSLYLSKVTGGAIPEDEARQILGRFGAIEKLWYCSDTDKEMFRLPDGVWVMFAFFQDCRDAQAQGFRDDPNYRLEQPKMPEDMRQCLGGRSSVAQNNHFNPNRVGDSPQAMVRHTIDSASVFVGNLPFGTTEDKLRELFGMYGRIVNIELVHKPSVNGMGVNVFAFIQYVSIEEADRAVTYCYQLEGLRLRVERKVSADSLARRDTLYSGGSPRTRMSTNPQNAMALVFQQGISIGMANANASQLPTAASSMYPAYNTFPQYGMPQFAPATGSNRLMENEASQGLHAHAPTFVPQSLQHGIAPMLGQLEMPTIMQAQTAHYTPSVAWTPQRTTNYQWPPVNSVGQTSPSIPTITKEEVP
ncbi:MAG: hypothetical protein Q9218_003187 [Villophora microphyllina]